MAMATTLLCVNRTGEGERETIGDVVDATVTVAAVAAQAEAADAMQAQKTDAPPSGSRAAAVTEHTSTGAT